MVFNLGGACDTAVTVKHHLAGGATFNPPGTVTPSIDTFVTGQLIKYIH